MDENPGASLPSAADPHGQGERGFFQIQTSALLSEKNFGFFEIYGVSTRTGGKDLSQCGHFVDKGRGSIFRDFMWTSFLDGL